MSFGFLPVNSFSDCLIKVRTRVVKIETSLPPYIFSLSFKFQVLLLSTFSFMTDWDFLASDKLDHLAQAEATLRL